MEFWYSADGQYYPEAETISLPSPDFAKTFDPDVDTEPDRYWGLVIHEFAHHVNRVWHDEDGHTPEMYAIVTGLVLKEGLPLLDFYMWESNYKPRSFKRGRKKAGEAILASLRKKGKSDVD